MYLQIHQRFLQAIDLQFGKRYFYLLFNGAKSRLEFWTSGIDLKKRIISTLKKKMSGSTSVLIVSPTMLRTNDLISMGFDPKTLPNFQLL